jgi:hypothetical protein
MGLRKAKNNSNNTNNNNNNSNNNETQTKKSALNLADSNDYLKIKTAKFDKTRKGVFILV